MEQNPVFMDWKAILLRWQYNTVFYKFNAIPSKNVNGFF